MRSIAGSAAIVLAMRWTDRVIGVASMIILARLLVPADYGIVAMASVVVAMADAILDLGVGYALMQRKDPDQGHYDTAWTLRLIQAALASGLVFSLAPWAGEFFREPRVVPVLQAMTGLFILGALENIGILTFQKEMRFDKDFQFLLARRLFGFAATMTIVWFWPTYWALVAGSLSGKAFGVALSYAMHPMRPRPSLARFADVFAVSQWMFIDNVGKYLNTKLHLMLAGQRASAEVVGAYSMGEEISSLPTTELLAPLNRVFFPAFVRVKGDQEELNRIFLLAQGVQALLGIPAGIGLILVAGDAVVLLLGTKWSEVPAFIHAFATANVAAAIGGTAGYLLVTVGKVRLLALNTWLQAAIFLVCALWFTSTSGALALAWTRAGVAVSGALVILGFVCRTCPGLGARAIGGVLFRPIAASCVMAGCVKWFASGFSLGATAMLLSQIAIGLVSYALAVCALWMAAGRPAGAESYLLGLLPSTGGKRAPPT